MLGRQVVVGWKSVASGSNLILFWNGGHIERIVGHGTDTSEESVHKLRDSSR